MNDKNDKRPIDITTLEGLQAIQNVDFQPSMVVVSVQELGGLLALVKDLAARLESIEHPRIIT